MILLMANTSVLVPSRWLSVLFLCLGCEVSFAFYIRVIIVLLVFTFSKYNIILKCSK
jgi:hypothetical protein